jgi:hypothetical protein
MAEIKVDISELKGEGGDTIKELAEFLKEKTKAEVDTSVNSINLKSEEKAVQKKYLRVLVRKFLHKSDLKDNYRVLGGEENSLKIKKKKTEED